MSTQINRRVTRSMTQVPTQEQQVRSQINRRVTRSMTQVATQEQQVRSQSQMDPAKCVEFITYEECQKRGLSNLHKKNGILSLRRVYLKTDMVHPMYLEKLSPAQRSNPDLRVVAPHGFLWKEDPRTTSYYSWDEWHRLVKNPYI